MTKNELINANNDIQSGIQDVIQFFDTVLMPGIDGISSIGPGSAIQDARNKLGTAFEKGDTFREALVALPE